MSFTRVTAAGISRGNLTDEEKLRAQQAQNDLQAQLALQEMAARERMHGKSDSTQRYGIDQQTAVAGTFGQRAQHEGGMFERQAGLSRDLDASATERAFGLADRQMAPAMMGAELAKTKYEDQAGVDRYVNQMVLERLKGMNAPAAPAAPGAAPAPAQSGLSDADVQMFGILAALKGGGSMPDFQTQAMQRQVSQMQLEEMKRNQAKGRALEQRDAGNVDQANALAAAGGVALPRVAAADFADRPDYTQALDRAKGSIGTFLNDATGGEDDVQGIQKIVESAIAALTSKGVDPAEARAYVLQALKGAVPARSGIVGKGLDALKYATPVGWMTGGAGESFRVDQLRDTLGF